MNAGQIHLLQDAMKRLGSSFERALADALLQHGDPRYFATALMAAFYIADHENQARIRMAFPDAWEIFTMSDFERLGKLEDAFQGLFDKYRRMTIQGRI